MPYKSDKQRRFFNSPTGKAKLGAEKVAEYNEASKGMKLPEAKEPKHVEKMPGLPKTRYTHIMKI